MFPSFFIGLFNASKLISDPILTLLDVFIVTMGEGFVLIPVTVIAGALYVQKKDPVMVSMYMIVSGALLGGGSLFAGYGDMSMLYTVFAGLGLGTLILSLYFGR